MVFSSLSFLFILFPFFLILDYASCLIKSMTVRNLFLLFISLLFYTWGESTNVILLIIMGLMNYFAGEYISKSKKKKTLISIFVGLNLSVLLGYKYTYWILSFFLPTFEGKIASMPLGISFFTFHAISYLLDIYRKDISPAKTLLDFLTYFCMFPHLVAGPIVRYAQVKEDIQYRTFSKELFSFGMFRLLIGLNKKVIIANSIAPIVDSAFLMSYNNNLHFFDAWVGILAYALQIYFDFSGYSDMGIGLAAMAGFHFEENFRRPYSSRSIKEFWSRWHISLSSWLRDYLYIPLGGSREGKLSTYRNLLIVFLLCGLWHGANLTFILWGLWHGAFLILERSKARAIINALPAPLGRAYTLLVVTVGWTFFRAESVSHALTYLQNLFTFSLHPIVLFYHIIASISLFIGLFLCLLPDKVIPFPESKNPNNFSISAYILQAILAVFSLFFLVSGTLNPFIYFNF